MRKFVVHTRALPGCCKTGDAPTVVEVEGEMITPMEDPSVMWLPKGEFYFRITAPQSLYEPKEVKQEDGTKKKEMVPPVYHSHAIYSNVHQATAIAERMIRSGMEFEIRKGRATCFDEEEFRKKCSDIQTLILFP